MSVLQPDPVLAAAPPGVLELFATQVAQFLRDDPTLKAMKVTINDDTYTVPEERVKFPAIDVTEGVGIDPANSAQGAGKNLLVGVLAIVVAVREPRVATHSPQLSRIRDAVYRRMNLLGGRDAHGRALTEHVAAVRMANWQTTNRYQLLASTHAMMRSVHDGVWLYDVWYQEHRLSIPTPGT